MKKIQIIYEDEGLIAVNKPAGLLVYLPKNHKIEETIVSILSDSISIPKNERSGIVHRLDRDTSGLILVAKNNESEKKLKKMFKDREIKKQYKALVWGKVEPKEGIINIPLGRGSKDRLRIVPKEGGRKSVTKYNVSKYFPKSDMTLLSVGLLTGRTHQIRVHFSSIGHPVVGDKKYSNRKTDLKRQFLHAESLIFNNPITNEKLELKVEIPKDLSRFIDKLS